MARRSSVARLDPRILEAVDVAIAEGRASIDAIVAMIRAMGGEASRSAVGRYHKTAEERLRAYRDRQQYAALWKAQMEANPRGDVGQMLIETLKMLADRSIEDAGDQDEATDPLALSRLTRAVRDLALADKTRADLVAQARDEAKADLEKKLSQVESDAAQQPMTPAQALERVRALYRGEG